MFSLIYVAAFHAFGRATSWFGALVGFVQAIFVLTMLMPILPAMHPRMANEQYGPTSYASWNRRVFSDCIMECELQSRSFVAHMIFGGILGAFYTIR
jgi:uncharacterized membrane protein YagU involved in acid resistance